MSTIRKKLHTLRHMNWRWALRYYPKVIRMNAAYYAAKFAGKKFVAVNIDGMPLRLSFAHPYHYFFARRMKRGGHEMNLLVMWKRESVDAPIVLDLGGYSGIFGLVSAKANPNSKVYIVEPDPVNFRHIEANIALNGLTNVFPVRGVVSDKNGTVAFTSHEGGEAGNVTAGTGDFTVPSITIDTWVETHGAPALIKLDVEGAEYRALAGGQKLLGGAKNLRMLLEVHYNFLKRYGDTEEALFELLRQNGYHHTYLDHSEYNTHYWVYKENKC